MLPTETGGIILCVDETVNIDRQGARKYKTYLYKQSANVCMSVLNSQPKWLDVELPNRLRILIDPEEGVILKKEKKNLLIM